MCRSEAVRTKKFLFIKRLRKPCAIPRTYLKPLVCFLRVHAQAADARVYHYREKDGLEVDAIVETADGRWAAFEIKLGERWIEEGRKSLLRVAERLAGTDHGKPTALAVIVPSGYGYFRPGEVGIVPINALGP